MVNAAASSEQALLARLRSGDRDAFAELVRAHHASMVRVAATFVASTAIAEEVVQDAWIAVIQGIDRFEGRSSLRTWIFSILVNIARNRGRKEARTVPVAVGAYGDDENSAPTVPADRFTGPAGRGVWSAPVTRWHDDPEVNLHSREVIRFVERVLCELPPARRQVMTLRDIEGLSSAEVCSLLDITEANQRVLLHRARAYVRGRLEEGGW